jgi:predicted GH43/DUF377 family glycosyl hydrolase
VLNPGAAEVNGRVALVYRAIGGDHLSRLGLAWSDDGRHVGERQFLYEPALDDAQARLGVEDPRLTPLEGALWVTYTKASVKPVGAPWPPWQSLPYRERGALARIEEMARVCEERLIFPDAQVKDAVLFPRRIGGLYHALTRIFPSIQITSSPDLRSWSQPRTLLEPRPGTWEAERIGPGAPPVETPFGWLLIYHGNAYYRREARERYYRMGLAVLDRDDPARVLYRHPDPIFAPSASYETGGKVPNVVFPSGLLRRDGLYYLYYGAGDDSINLATAPVESIHAFLERALRA